MTLETKECSKCHEVKSLEDFRDNRNKCKSCEAQRQKERVENLKAANSLLSLDELRVRTPQKKCNKCKQILSSTEFSRSNSRKSGLGNICRSCSNAESSATRARYIKQNEDLSLEQLRQNTPEKWCWSCEQTLPTTEFYRSNVTKSGLAGECRDCNAELSSEWSKSNPEKCRQRTARRKAKKNGLFWEDMPLDQILERDGLTCAWCGVVPDSYELDHVRPLDLNGIHAPFNIVASCVSCNRSKSNLEPATWVSKRLREGITAIPSQSALEAVRLAYSGVHEELKAQIDSKNQMALAA